jgi:hypothetical protein
MSWQRAVFFGGAVLVLSACGDATAPSSMRQVGGTLNNRKATVAVDSTVAPTGGKDDECTGIVIHVGLDGSAVPVCLIIQPPSTNW